LAVLTAVFFSCNIIEPPLSMEDSRRVEDSLQGTSGDVGGRPYNGQELRDTVFLISAVVFPEDYDWQRDSIFGDVSCSLRIYRNSEIALEIPAGIDARVALSPDYHHIISGSVFTEYADAQGTTVKKDGEVIAEWGEREKLHGLMIKDGVVHTLGLSLPGGELVYRRDGTPVRKIKDGIPVGGFGMDGYGPCGAMYEVEGQVCFVYKNVYGDSQTLTLVKDGKTLDQSVLQSANILDARVGNLGNALLYTSGGTMSLFVGDSLITRIGKRDGLHCVSGQIVDYRDCLSVAGMFRDEKRNYMYGILRGQEFIRIEGTPAYIYCRGQNYAWMEQPPGDRPDCYFFHRNCACLLDDGLAMVLTPKNQESPPFLKYKTRVTEFNLHGYLSGLAVEIPE